MKLPLGTTTVEEPREALEEESNVNVTVTGARF